MVICRGGASGGKALTTRAEAAGETALTLQFRDGTLDAVPADGAPPPAKPRPAPAPKRALSAPKQDDLFG